METKAALKLVPVTSRVRITNIDKFGFCGREFPPDQSDVGRVCTVDEVVRDDHSSPGQEEFVIVVAVPDGQPWRKLELIDIEIEECC